MRAALPNQRERLDELTAEVVSLGNDLKGKSAVEEDRQSCVDHFAAHKPDRSN